MANQNPDGGQSDRAGLFRYSIRHLIIWTASVAVACVALRASSQASVSFLHAIALSSLSAAILLAIYRSGPKRAYWIGFAVCGWLYVAMLVLSWNSAAEQRHLNAFDQDQLLTTWLSKKAYQYAYPYTAKRLYPTPVSSSVGVLMLAGPAGSGSWNTAPPPTLGGAPEHEFVNTAHGLWTLFLAACGGTLARWLYMTRDTIERGPSGEQSDDKPDAG